MSIMFRRIFQDLQNLLLSHSLLCALVQDVVILDTISLLH